MWCWRRMEMISWNDGVRNQVLQGVKKEIKALHKINWRKANWIGHILHRDRRVKQVTEGKIEVTRRRGRRGKQLLSDLRGNRRYFNLQELALDRTLWRTGLGTGYGPVVRQYVTDNCRDWGQPRNTALEESVFWSRFKPEYIPNTNFSTLAKFLVLVCTSTLMFIPQF